MKLKHSFHLAFVFIASLVMTNCGDNSTEPTTLDLGNMDTSLNPADDFYGYVNGQWMKNTEIPEEEGRWGSFDELRKSNSEIVLNILERASVNSDYANGTDQRKAANFYAVGMDTALAEARGISPIKPYLTKIEAIKNVGQLKDVLSEMHTLGFSGFYSVGVFSDLMQSDMNSLYLDADGLGLPNCDYYTKDDSSSKVIRDKYLVHIARMLTLIHEDDKDYLAEAQTVYDIEHQLALASLTPIMRRNLELLYNKMSISDLSNYTPSINWDDYLKNVGIENSDSIITLEPNYMAEVETLIQEKSLNDIQWYLKWHLINRASPYLTKEISQADFEFYGTVLNGTSINRDRWERVLQVTNNSLGEALGKLYVDEVFPPEAKAEATEMVDNLLEAFGDRIKALDWMGDTTKQAALKKLDNFTVKIGYPDKWKDYSSLTVENSGDNYSYFDNILHASRFAHAESIAKIGKPVDKTEWHMNPQAVNAYYSPLNNEIVFPAAILQPPFYYYLADPAINFGAIGAVIGHEASHGFDDNGSKFDENGNMKNWWSEEDEEQFKERSKLLVAQFDAYEPLEGLFVQGELTLGENIGDLGGVNIAYDGMQKYFETHEKPAEIEGFTQEQRFFMSWATVWRTKYRDEALRNQVMSGPHSPAMYRATGPLTNLETFYEAFNIIEGNEMWKPEGQRVKIW